MPEIIKGFVLKKFREAPVKNKGRDGTNHGLFRKSLTVKTVAD